MFSLLRTRPALPAAARQLRFYSPQLALAKSDPSPPPQPQSPTAAATTLPYLVRRNTKGSIPVYTDLRNGGTRSLVLIRNVEGNVDALADDLARSLFPEGSPDAARLKIQVNRNRHLTLSGGRWKPDVVRWLVSKGF